MLVFEKYKWHTFLAAIILLTIIKYHGNADANANVNEDPDCFCSLPGYCMSCQTDIKSGGLEITRSCNPVDSCEPFIKTITTALSITTLTVRSTTKSTTTETPNSTTESTMIMTPEGTSEEPITTIASEGTTEQTNTDNTAESTTTINPENTTGSSTEDHISVQIYDAFKKLYAIRTGPSEDIGKQFEKIASKAGEIIEVFGEAGHIVSKFLKFAAGGSEIKWQVTELHKIMVAEFVKLNNDIKNMINEFSLKIFLNDYANSVSIPLNENADQFNALIDTRENDTNGVHMKVFRDRCTDRQSSFSIIKEILNTKLNTNCIATNISEVNKVFLRSKETFDTIGRHVPAFQMSSEEYSGIKSRLISQLVSMPISKAFNMLHKFDSACDDAEPTQIEQKLLEFHELVKIDVTIPQPYGCLLETILHDSNWKTQSLLEFARIVLFDLSKASFTATQCVYLLYYGQNLTIEAEMGKIKNFTSDIIKNMGSYIDQRLMSAWPKIMIQYANETFDSLSTKIEASEYIDTAAKIKAAVDARGPIIYNHTVVVTPGWGGEDSFMVRCDETVSCFKLLDIHNINVIVYRLVNISYEQFKKHRDWFAGQRDNIDKAFHEHVRQFGYCVNWYDNGKLYELLAFIASKLDQFEENSKCFDSVVFLQNWKWSKIPKIIAEVPLGLASSSFYEFPQQYYIYEFNFDEDYCFYNHRYELIFLIN